MFPAFSRAAATLLLGGEEGKEEGVRKLTTADAKMPLDFVR